MKVERQKITPCLWFNGVAEEAVRHYTSIFPRSRVLETSRYTDAGPGPEGAVLLITFELDGQQLQALNAGPEFSFTEALSLSVSCDTQEEVDRLWSALSAGGEEGPCGWLKDRYGVSWQIVPSLVPRVLLGEDRKAAGRVMRAVFGMKKLDIAALERALRGG